MKKPKTLKWINPRDDFYLTTDDIPHVLYRIHEVEPFVFGLFCYRGYIRECEDTFLCKGESADSLKKIAQSHWDDYVNKNFMEEDE